MFSTLCRYKQSLSQDRLERMRDTLSQNLNAACPCPVDKTSQAISLQTRSTPTRTHDTSPEVTPDNVSSPALSGTSDSSWLPRKISTLRRARYKVYDWVAPLFFKQEPHYESSNPFPPLYPSLYSGVESPRGTRYDDAGRPFMGPKERPAVWISTEVIVQRYPDPVIHGRRRPVF